jgi:hypothetical protein
MAAIQRRRAERLFLTFPIRVEGSDAKGEPFREQGRTLVVNRHGARIQLGRSIHTGKKLRITNVVANHTADFRVIGPTAPSDTRGGEWGVECQELDRNIWGIDFTRLQEDGPACSAVLECRRCGKVGLTPVSFVELDVLESSGLLTRPCDACGQATPWGYKQNPPGSPPPGQDTTLAGDAAEGGPRRGAERRASARAALRLPMRVRSWYGVEDFPKSENVSKGGLAFTSDKHYQVGKALKITCPYKVGMENIEVRGRVVRRVEIKGSGRFLYGIKYQKEN